MLNKNGIINWNNWVHAGPEEQKSTLYWHGFCPLGPNSLEGEIDIENMVVSNDKDKLSQGSSAPGALKQGNNRLGRN